MSKKIRYVFVLMIIGLLLCLLNPKEGNAYSYSKHGPIYVFIDGKEPSFTNVPFVKDGTTLVEFRTVMEMLGFKIDWNPSTKTITGTKKGVSIRFQLNSQTAYVNGKKMSISQAPTTLNGRTVIPLRFIAETSGKNVDWDQHTRMIIINDGHFKKADFSFTKVDLNQNLIHELKKGNLGPFHASLIGTSLAEVVNSFGFPDARHDGTPNSDDIPFVIYGDYILYFLGTKGSNYLANPFVREFHAILPTNTKNQDIITLFGNEYNQELGLYFNIIYNFGPYPVVIETDGFDRNDRAYYLSVGLSNWD